MHEERRASSAGLSTGRLTWSRGHVVTWSRGPARAEQGSGAMLIGGYYRYSRITWLWMCGCVTGRRRVCEEEALWSKGGL